MSTSGKSKRRGKILDEIMSYHRQQLPKTMRDVPLADLRALASVRPPVADFYAALERPGVSLIAECKKASPSKGLLSPQYEPSELARAYLKAGASAISVLTDARYFQGSLSHLRDVKEALADHESLVAKQGDPRTRVGIPVLRKDFIFHPYQVYEARVAGADAILLITAVLNGSELGHLLTLAHELGMNALVEVHTEKELGRALMQQPRIIGINNRNLQTFEVDYENTAQLRALVPDGVLVVGESGIKTADDVRKMAEIGVNAVLVGETLVRSKDVQKTARDLVIAGLQESSFH